MKFAKHFETTVNTLDELFQHYSFEIKNRAIICYKQVAEAVMKVHCGGKLPKYLPGLPAKRLPKIAENFISIEVLNRLFNVLLTEKSYELVCTTMEVICLLLDSLGPAMIQNNLEDLVTCIDKLFKHETQC